MLFGSAFLFFRIYVALSDLKPQTHRALCLSLWLKYLENIKQNRKEQHKDSTSLKRSPLMRRRGVSSSRAAGRERKCRICSLYMTVARLQPPEPPAASLFEAVLIVTVILALSSGYQLSLCVVSVAPSPCRTVAVPSPKLQSPLHLENLY